MAVNIFFFRTNVVTGGFLCVELPFGFLNRVKPF